MSIDKNQANLWHLYVVYNVATCEEDDTLEKYATRLRKKPSALWHLQSVVDI